MVTSGNVHDIIPSHDLLEGIINAYILADKAYFSEQNIKYIEENKERNLIENFFSRFDKTCSAFLGFVALASTFIWLR